MKYLIKSSGFQTYDREEAIREATRVYLECCELDNRSRKKTENIFRQMLLREEGMVKDCYSEGWVEYGWIRVTIIR
ncbi:hypothetical protein IL310_13135 [Lactococcus lactis]|nr:hypothetical protein IL310_13135 [Lactococcus lactis]